MQAISGVRAGINSAYCMRGCDTLLIARCARGTAMRVFFLWPRSYLASAASKPLATATTARITSDYPGFIDACNLVDKARYSTSDKATLSEVELTSGIYSPDCSPFRPVDRVRAKIARIYG
jgi:hypothetical protein